MSIAIEIYDFFSYLIPGTLYLYIFNEILRAAGWKYLDIQNWFKPDQAPDAIMFIPVLVIGYLLGYLISPIAHRLFRKPIYQLWDKRKVYKRALDELKEKYPDLNIEYEAKDWDILFQYIRQRNLDMAHILDKFNAINMMLTNIALGIFLFALLQLTQYWLHREGVFLINLLGAVILSGLALYSSNEFRLWFFTGIFISSLEYGGTLKQVIEHKIEQSGILRSSKTKRKLKKKFTNTGK